MTVSDGVAAGTREDESGKLLVDLLTEEGFEVQHRVVPDVDHADVSRVGDVRQLGHATKNPSGAEM